jgi:hypothetical protein
LLAVPEDEVDLRSLATPSQLDPQEWSAGGPQAKPGAIRPVPVQPAQVAGLVEDLALIEQGIELEVGMNSNTVLQAEQGQVSAVESIQWVTPQRS